MVDAVWPPTVSRRDALEFHVLTPQSDADGSIALRYAIRASDGSGTLGLTARITLPGDAVENVDQDVFDHLVRLLALAAATSYYKAVIPPKVIVDWPLTPREKRFAEDLFRYGLAEFAYRNDVPEALRPEVVAPVAEEKPVAAADSGDPSRLLVAVGGGKDSIVSIETLRRLPVGITLFSVNEYAPIRATADQAGLELAVATRKLDPALFELNRAGALNGHVPVTAINSLIGLLTAVRSGYDGVVFSNESSSSSGNVEWEGIDGNHQWSKGIEFETSLRELVGDGAPAYFSLLRPLTELAISRRFAELRQYHSVFTSCNRAFHLDPEKRRLWCGDCPKCRFVFLILAPFMSRHELLEVFSGRDLLADESQREGFLELLNVGGRLKPFECVGEVGECRAAVSMLRSIPGWVGHSFFDDPSVAAVADVSESEVAELLAFRSPHFVPPAFLDALREIR